MKEYLKASWIDARLEARSSPIHGRGIFVTAPIAEGETLIIWGGTLFRQENIDAGEALQHSYAAISEELFLGHTAEHGASVDDYINHSCDPAVWMLDEVTLAARRALAPGDELTVDYAMYLDSDWERRPCHCGTRLCRKWIDSEDWRRPELFERYRYHFSPFINERLRKLRSAA
ncbi:SET domain-containing protein [Archangium lansingense]|uniref:SET domain-containing protein-lysine N-methyltransferase n=1 Tax=Archangium lansingense TaxID=2995310 RepID=A0ABT3ZVY2_9BACT|nr:SET domain-containing protein-lysine N-methyltransferase [Archangium lansinium]MCY1073559.1 SET domain-containing protein-lysine N-methyltransferase [Archangium lansinium]